METSSEEYGAFVEKFVLQGDSSSPNLPLNSLTFAVKDIINGENIHFGTPTNPCAPDRIPGGSSSGSAVAVAANLVDFSIGTDCIGSARIPASYCGIFGIRPSHGAIPRTGVTPMAPSLDTLGWFARDATILNKIGQVLLHLPNVKNVRPSHIIIADDSFQLSTIPYDAQTKAIIKASEKLYGGDVLKHQNLGDYVKDNVPSLKHFMNGENGDSVHNVPALAALTDAMQSIARTLVCWWFLQFQGLHQNYKQVYQN